MAELRIRRAGPADWATIWPVWHEIVAAGDTFAYDPDTSFDEGERMWFGPEPEETWVAGSDDGVVHPGARSLEKSRLDFLYRDVGGCGILSVSHAGAQGDGDQGDCEYIAHRFLH